MVEFRITFGVTKTGGICPINQGCHALWNSHKNDTHERTLGIWGGYFFILFFVRHTTIVRVARIDLIFRLFFPKRNEMQMQRNMSGGRYRDG